MFICQFKTNVNAIIFGFWLFKNFLDKNQRLTNNNKFLKLYMKLSTLQEG